LKLQKIKCPKSGEEVTIEKFETEILPTLLESIVCPLDGKTTLENMEKAKEHYDKLPDDEKKDEAEGDVIDEETAYKMV